MNWVSCLVPWHAKKDSDRLHALQEAPRDDILTGGRLSIEVHSDAPGRIDW